VAGFAASPVHPRAVNERTSTTHPIRLDVLPSGLPRTPGRLGLTFTPGKNAPGVDCTWRRDLRADLERLHEVYGVGAMVNLLEDHEMAALGIAGYAGEVQRLGVVLRRLPIADSGVPRDVDEVGSLVRWVLAQLAAGTHVAVHCRGGLGRAGTVVACCLVGAGHAPEEAMREVRATRSDAIENAAQEVFARGFGLHLASAGQRSRAPTPRPGAAPR
jgi:protein-tyrosine phosphatase